MEGETRYEEERGGTAGGTIDLGRISCFPCLDKAKGSSLSRYLSIGDLKVVKASTWHDLLIWWRGSDRREEVRSVVISEIILSFSELLDEARVTSRFISVLSDPALKFNACCTDMRGVTLSSILFLSEDDDDGLLVRESSSDATTAEDLSHEVDKPVVVPPKSAKSNY